MALGTIFSTLAQPILGERAGGIFGDILGNVLGGQQGRTQQGQGTAYERSTTSLPQETQASGSAGSEAVAAPVFAPKIEIGTAGAGMGGAPMQAGFGSLIGTGTQLARKFAPELFGGLVLGGGAAVAPMVLDAFGEPKKLRVTKKLKSQVRQAVNLMGIEATAQAMGVSQDVVIYILMKKMRNDGPYVTKAAVRKTRQTVRKMKNLCDMYDDLRPAAKRRPPMRRAAGTRITQVK
jgi:hypothetical protein